MSGADLGGGGFVGFERTLLFADSFDLLVLCYSQQCTTLSASWHASPVWLLYNLLRAIQFNMHAVHFFYLVQLEF